MSTGRIPAAPHAVLCLLLLAAALCAAELSRFLSAGVADMSAVWPSLGIAVGGALVLGRRVLVGYAVVMFVWFLFQGASPLLAAFGAMQQGIEAWLAVTLIRWKLRRSELLSHLPDTLRFYFWGAFLPTLPLTLLTSWALHSQGRFVDFSLLDVWLVFWLAEILGVMLFAPIAQYLTYAAQQGRLTLNVSLSGLMFSLVLAALLTTSLLLMGEETSYYGKMVSYLFFPLLAWAAMGRHQWRALAGMPLVGVVVPALILVGIDASTNLARVELVEAVVLVTLMTLMTQLIQSASRERRRLSDQFRYQAHRDFSSGLLNDRGLLRRISTVTQKFRQQAHWLVVLNLRDFDESRRLYSESFGGSVERFVGRRIAVYAGEEASVARLGPGRFGFILSATDETTFRQRIEQLCEALHGLVYEEQGGVYRLSIAIGTAPLNAQVDQETSLAAAGHAAVFARRLNDLPVYHSSAGDELFRQQQAQLARLEVVKEALNEDRLILFCQEIRALDEQDSGVSLEVLVRMRAANGSVLPPSDFLPVAQAYGLTGEVDRCVVRKTFEWLADHPERVAALGKVSINLSGSTLSDPGFLPWLEQLQVSATVPAEKICFEVTESELIADWGQARELLETVRARGFKVSLDDFGTGLATFEYLTGFPFDFVKIDGMFVRDLLDNDVHRAIVSSVTSVASSMGLRTIAEFVGDERLIPCLTELGVDYVQGFAIGKPMPIGEFMLRLDEFSNSSLGMTG